MAGLFLLRALHIFPRQYRGQAWLLLAADADWRWLRERQDSPWYPSLRLYRQKMPGQWLPVLQSVRRDLESLAGNARPKMQDM